jgi:hypothetical protein
MTTGGASRSSRILRISEARSARLAWRLGDLLSAAEEPAVLVAHNYSITWSARSSTDCGIVRLSALAVLRLITNSNVVGCSTGRSAGSIASRRHHGCARHRIVEDRESDQNCDTSAPDLVDRPSLRGPGAASC